MSKVFALIKDNKVINVALYDSLEHAQQDTEEDTNAIEILEGTRNPDVDSIWDGEKFIPPAPVAAPVVEEAVAELVVEPTVE